MERSEVAALAIGALLLAIVPGCRASTSAKDHRELANRLVLQFVEAENAMNVSLFDEIFPENYIQHNPDVPPGRAGVKKVFGDQFKKIADAHLAPHWSAEDVIVDGDRVVLRQLVTFDKDGKHYQERSIDEWRVVDGQLGEHWDTDTAPRVVPAPAP